MMFTDKRAFTLIELIVVIVIIGILAAVAVPIMTEMKKKAILSEAITALSTIITAEKLYILEHGVGLSAEQGRLGLLGIGPGVLTGTYFNEESYSVDAQDTSHWYSYCYPGFYCKDASVSAEWGGYYLLMGNDGKLYSDNPNAGLPNWS